MPLVEQPTPDPLVLIPALPELEPQRGMLYSTAKGYFHKRAWLQTSAGVSLAMALHRIPFVMPLSHFQRHSLLPTQQQ